MKNNYTNLNYGKCIGLIYDVPDKLTSDDYIQFPENATQEWEDQKTIHKIHMVWKSLGFKVILFPLNQSFFELWHLHRNKCDLIHSLVEGFGSISREAWIPSLCELSGLPFIGPSAFAHTFCMNKALLKSYCVERNIPTAPFYFIKSKLDIQKINKSFFSGKIFIKPNFEGSGMGIDASISISHSFEEFEHLAMNLLMKFPDGILAEKYLQGPEYTSAMLGSELIFLPIAQIEVDDGVYGAVNKSKDVMGEKVTFPLLNKNIHNSIEQGTKYLFKNLPLEGISRLDWKCDDEGHVYFLEANTLPGLSYYYSVVPLMAKHIGIEYEELFQILSDDAFSREKGAHLWYGKTRLQSRN